MFRKLFLVFLLTALFLISCKTSPPEESSDSAALIAEGTTPGDTEIIDINSIDTGEAQPEVSREETGPDVDEEPPQVSKLPSKSGGMKTRSTGLVETVPSEITAEDSKEAIPGDITGETPLVDSLVTTGNGENLPESYESSTGPEIIPPTSPHEDTTLDETEVPVTEESPLSEDSDSAGLPPDSILPSDIEMNSYNPLLPVVIIPGNLPPETDSTEMGNLSTQKPPDASVEEAAKSSPSTTSTLMKPPQDNENIDSTQTSANNGKIRPEPSEPISNSVYSLAADPSGKLIINLQGAGWIYLSGSHPGIILRDKSYDPSSGRTRFVFSGPDLKQSEAELIFLKQDLLRGESSQQSLILNTGNNPLLAEINTEVRQESSETVNQSGTDMANQDMKPIKSPDSPERTDQLTYLDQSAPAETASDMSSSAPMATEKLSFPPVDLTPGELLELAGKYEASGPEQSLEKAIYLYEKIKNEFPVTEERFIAEERIRYLNKHYFKVQ